MVINVLLLKIRIKMYLPNWYHVVIPDDTMTRDNNQFYTASNDNIYQQLCEVTVSLNENGINLQSKIIGLQNLQNSKF